jgi:folate-binding protein YgfZ
MRNTAETRGFVATDRAVLRIGGSEARSFLQGLISNDVRRLDEGAIYAALLTPQGKYLFDFFLVADGADVLLDVAKARAPALIQRLMMYRLRAPVSIDAVDLSVIVGVGDAPAGAYADPRNALLGWRMWVPDPDALHPMMRPLDPAEVTALRVALAVPEAGAELVPDESYLLEMDFERLNGVDFRKGCYVGQEVTARMKHKTMLKKGLARVEIEGTPPPPGTGITSDGRTVGTLYTSAGQTGLAYLRFDRADGPMQAGDATITRSE